MPVEAFGKNLIFDQKLESTIHTNLTIFKSTKSCFFYLFISIILPCELSDIEFLDPI